MKSHEVLSNVFIPETGITYPEKPDQPMFEPKRIRKVVLDEKYPYLDKSFFARLRHVAIYAGIFCLVFPTYNNAFEPHSYFYTSVVCYF